MGKKSQPKAPELPDVENIIRTEARTNRVNTYNPYGSQEFTENRDGTWDSNVQFSPELMALFDRQKEMAGAAPSRFTSRGMGDGLRARIDAKLGRGSDSVSTQPVWDAVEMPVEQEVPEPTTPSVPRGQQPYMGAFPSARSFNSSPSSLKPQATRQPDMIEPSKWRTR